MSVACWPSRATPQAARAIEAEGLPIDVQHRQVRLRGRAVELTAKAFEPLAMLACSAGRVFPYAELLGRVRGFARDVFERTVASGINRLRGEVEPDPAKPGCRLYRRATWPHGCAGAAWSRPPAPGRRNSALRAPMPRRRRPPCGSTAV